MANNHKLNIFCDYCPFSLKGGIEKALVRDIKNLKAKYDINLFATCDAENCEEKLCNKNSDINFHIVYGRYKTKQDTIIMNMKLFFKILRTSRDICSQLVYVHSNKSGFPAFLASKLLKSYLVVFVHFVWPFCVKATLLKDEKVYCKFKIGTNQYQNFKHCLKECFETASLIKKVYALLSYCFDQLLVKTADKVICLNNDAQKRLLQLGVDPNKLTLTTNPVNVEKVNESDILVLRKKFGISKNERMVLFAGRLSPEKGLDVLISAMKKLPENVKLVIAGRIEAADDYFKKISTTVKNLNLGNRVFFSGFLDNGELSMAYAACDVFVYPTLCYEMFGTSIFEALLFKKPVVTSNFGGISSLLNYERAALVESGNVSQLSKAISKCLFDSSYANKIATNGFNFAKKYCANPLEKMMIYAKCDEL